MNHSLLNLLQLSDPALPIGGFSHSGGLETYVQLGVVHDKITAADYVRAVLSDNLSYNDGAFLSLSMDALVLKDLPAIFELDDMSNATKLPEETRQASVKLGARLLKIFMPLLNNELLNDYNNAIKLNKIHGHYSIAFALVAHAANIDKRNALFGYYYNASAGMVTNCVKLIPLSQQHGQEILFSLHDYIAELVERSMSPNVNMLGICCAGFDIRSMQHERLYSRLYMS